MLTYMTLLNTLVPISLVVSLEVVKVSQSYFIANDANLFNVKTGQKPIVTTSSINEELGQVEYIFTDKTGTLT